MVISFSGLDGAGKSSLIASVKTALEQERQSVAVLHLNEQIGVYAFLQRVRDLVLGIHRAPDAPPRRLDAPRSRWGRLRDAVLWSTWLRRLLYPVDLAIFAVYRLYHERLRGRVLIMDRYFYDRLVDVASHRSRGEGLLRILAHLTPTPDLPVFLEITPEESFARKGEYSVAYLRRRAAWYARIAPWIPSALTVPTQQLDVAQQTVTRVVTARLRTPRSTSRRRRESDQALLALRLVLGDPTADPEALDWSGVARWAAANAILVRLATAAPPPPPPSGTVPPAVRAHVHAARRRTRALLALMQTIEWACEREEVGAVFPKALQHYPDSGADLDLVVLDTEADVDRAILAGAPALPRHRSLRDRLAGTTSYLVSGLRVDISHGRLGVLGEQRLLAWLLVQHRRVVRPDGIARFVPSPEDGLLLQGLQRVAGKTSFRIGDVAATIATLRSGAIDWNYLLDTADRCALVEPLRTYLTLVEQIHRTAYDGPLLPAAVAQLVLLDNAGVVEFRGGLFRFSAIRNSGRVFLHQLTHHARSGRWREASRLGLLPVVAVAAGLGRLSRLANPPRAA